MLNQKEILSTIEMIDQQHLDIRTITMGISLLSCCDPDPKRACEKIYEKITRYAENLVKTGEDIEREFGIPIVNKRISVTPMALVAGGRCRPDDAEDGSEQGADSTHGRGAPARLDAFHGSSSISLRCFSVYHESLPGAMGLYRKQRP